MNCMAPELRACYSERVSLTEEIWRQAVALVPPSVDHYEAYLRVHVGCHEPVDVEGLLEQVGVGFSSAT